MALPRGLANFIVSNRLLKGSPSWNLDMFPTSLANPHGRTNFTPSYWPTASFTHFLVKLACAAPCNFFSVA